MSFSSTTVQWPSPTLPTSQTSNPETSTSMANSPTSAPKSPTDKERKPKLRASCDACAASKVKCDKQHPTCGRCATNNSQCIYGISRKHGKPGRTRKRNRDGTPFIKGSKQRHATDGGEFRKFRIYPEPALQPLRTYSETASNWSSRWSSTPGTPTYEYDVTPEPFYMDATDLSFMDDISLPNGQLKPQPMQNMEPEPSFRDPFMKRPSLQLSPPEIQNLGDYVGGDVVNPMDYTFQNTNIPSYTIDSTSPTPHSPKSNVADNCNLTQIDPSPPSTHCCYTLAYSTLYSLRTLGPDSTSSFSDTECKSLDEILSVTRLAIQSVLQLLSCPCSTDPHLAMLYSSITFKLLTWYRIAAGINVATPSGASPALSNSPIPSSSHSSPLSRTASGNDIAFNNAFQSMQFNIYQLDEAEQQRQRRQAVLNDLEHCRQLVEALANWDSKGASEQGKFLYDVLGAWLKSELFKTVRDVGGGQAL